MIEPTLDDAVQVARDLALRRCTPAAVRALLASGFPITLPAHANIPGSVRAAHCLVITGGLLRAHVCSPDGRQTTSGYLRRGDLLCPLARQLPDVGVIPLVDTTGWVMDVDRVRRCMAEDAELGTAVAEYSISIVYAAIEQLRFASFATVRQRVIRHLCELIAEKDAELELALRPQEIADAVGTVREVVSRTLRELERGGLIRCRRGGVLVRSRHRLFDEIRDLAPIRLTTSLRDPAASALCAVAAI